MNKTKIALGLAALLGAASVMAQSATNPLVRPVSSQAARSASPGAPPSPNEMGYMQGNADAGMGGKNDKSDERVKSAQNLLFRYNVVAITADAAVLRVTSAPSGAAAAGQGGSASSGSGASSTQNVAELASVLPSLMVKRHQKLLIQDVEVVADVQDGQVTLRTVDGKRSIYSGRLDGNSAKVHRGFNWASVDTAYTARQSPPVSKNATATSPAAAANANGQAQSNQSGLAN